MSDTARRHWERRWRVDPADQGSLRRAIAARRRTGLPVPAGMLDRQVHPPRTFETDLPCRVWTLPPTGQGREVPQSAALNGGVWEVPEHRVWYVLPNGYPDVRTIVRQLRDQGIQGLALTAPHYVVTDRDVERLTELATITHLDLGDCHQLTDAGLERLVAGLPGLVELKLRRCERITGRGLAHLTRLPALARLRLAGGQRLDDDAVRPLGALPLVALNLAECRELTDAGLRHLASLEELVALSLQQCNRITDGGLRHLRPLRRLSTLNLSWCQRIPDDGLEHLGSLGRLRILELHGCNRLTDRGLKHLPRLAGLTKLTLGPSVRGITDAGLASLARLRRLRHLNLSWCEEITDEGLGHLEALPALAHLDLMGCSALTDAGLAHIARLPRLQHLNLWRCEGITDDGLARLQRLPNLTLNLSTRVQDLINPTL